MQKKQLAVALTFLLGLVQLGMPIEIVSKENVALNMHGRLQTLGFSDYVLDEFRDHTRLYLFVRQARLAFDGNVNTIKYKIQIAFGGEDGVQNTAGTVSNTSQGLLDYYADIPLFRTTVLQMGQFKVPYGLERLENSGD